MTESPQPSKPAEKRPRSAMGVIKVALGTAAFLAWITSPSWMAYRWPVSKRQWLGEDKWTIAHEGKSSDIVYPWTWLWPYTHSILAVNLGDVRRNLIKPEVYVTPVISFVRDNGRGEPVETFMLYAFDTERGQIAELLQCSLADLKGELAKPPLPDDYMSHLEWREADGNEAWSLAMKAVQWRVAPDKQRRSGGP